MKHIDEDIASGKYKNIYLLFGEERYLLLQYKDKLRKALVNEGDSMNYTAYEGEGISVKEVIDLAETMPFLAQYRVIELSGTGLFKKGGDELADYLQNVPESTIFIICETEVDKRGRAYKAAKEHGRAIEFSLPEERDVRTWIRAKVSKAGKRISEQTVQYFLEIAGADMGTMAGEIEKLICYAMEREEITRADVDAISTRQITGEIFNMVEAVARGQQTKALALYGNLLALKEPPMRILFLITRQFHHLLQVKLLKKDYKPEKEMASILGVPPFAVSKYVAQAEKFTEKELRRAVEECVAAEEDIKTGQMVDTLAVELLIVKYSAREKMQ